MFNTVWFPLFLVAAGAVVALAAALARGSASSPSTLSAPSGTRDYQEEYTSPDFGDTAGFAITSYPSNDILIPGRFWLINGRTAEIEYNIVPNNFARLRVAEDGNLDIPDAFTDNEHESATTYPVGDIEVTQSQSPGRRSMLQWRKGEFEYVLLSEEPEMNVLGGVSTDFVTQTEANKTS